MADSQPISDSELLSQIGFAVNVNTGASVAQSCLYGFLVALMLYGIRIQRQRYGHSSSGKMMMGVMLSLFLFATMDFIVGIYLTIRITRDFLVFHPEMSLIDRVSQPDLQVQKLEVVAATMTAANFFLADGVVVWRARMICEKQRKLLYVPLILLFAMGVSSCAFIILMALYPTHEVVAPYADKLQTAVWALSLSTNMFATGMIAYKIWLHRAFERSFLLSRRRTSSEKILVLLVDSGTIYCLIQVVYITVHLQASKSQNWALAATLLLVICTQLSAIYPTLILVLVSLRYSLVDDDTPVDDEAGNMGHSSTEDPIAFCPGDATQTTLDISATNTWLRKSSSIDSRAIGAGDTFIENGNEKCKTAPTPLV